MVEPGPSRSRGGVDVAEYERLRRDHGALKDQLGATSDVLEAMGRSAADPDAVLRTIVESARRLCRSEAAHLYLLEDDTYRVMTTVGLSEESRRLLIEHPIAADRETLTGRVGLERRTLGSKTGCRRLFAEVGVPHPLGAEDLRRLDEVADAVLAMRAARPSMQGVIVKLNEGVSGAGNALVRLDGLPVPGAADERAAVLARLGDMELESKETPREVYLAKLEEGAGIVEERITGTDLRSPSVQLRVLPNREVELLSTHDQLLGGASGQSYLGCTFPASAEYAAIISEQAARVGGRLAELGALGRFAVDFVVVRDDAGSWSSYAIELNLRRGGTTHPFLTLQFLTDGRYHPDSGLFLTPRGREKHLVATDHLESDVLRGLAPADLFDIVARHGLLFDQSLQAGVVFHMISCLTEHGRVGLTAVGDTPADAWERYVAAERILLEEARLALQEQPLPG